MQRKRDQGLTISHEPGRTHVDPGIGDFNQAVSAEVPLILVT
jgi:hypothetical protein